MRARVALALLSAWAMSSACQSREPPKPWPSPSSSAASSSRPLASVTPPPAREVRVVGCRVLGVHGPNAKTSGATYAGRFFDGSGWLDLSEELSLSLKHSETTREFAIHGPGRFLVCPGGDESVLVASGAFSSTAGPGSRAGAEVLIGTPFGTIRYGDANLRADVQPKGLELRVTQGSAVFDRAGEAGKPDPKKSVEGPKGRVSVAATPDAQQLSRRCEELRGRVARWQKPSVPALPSAGPSLAEWAVAQVKAREEARVACAAARALSGRLEEPERSRISGISGSPVMPELGKTETVPDAGK